ncbi:MAG: branched-chain amino acid ABC transporter substrate-binding protein [Deltaproteobacteria bacterium]|jgi:branched-chain amino acid transport system substrate-binding protein|nr:branched-chain amino acid ABC transporter substrate-binding protein [Deltaproteobacteria bacterium]
MSKSSSLRFTPFLVIKVILALIGLISATSPGVAQAEGQNKLLIGFGGALLGNLASYGQSNFYGLEYAVLQANSNGGILGRTVEIVPVDDSCNPTLALTAANKLLGKGIKIVLGHTCSTATRSALDVYGDKALVISGSSTENSLTESGKYPYFFRATPRDDIQIKLWLDLITKKGYRKIAILHDNNDYGRSLAETARDRILANTQQFGELALFEGVTSGQLSFDAVIAKLKEIQPDVLIWGGYFHDAAKLVTQLRQNELKTVIIGSDGLYDQRFLNIAQQAAEGVYCSRQENHGQSQAAKAALADHQKRYYSQDVGNYFYTAAGAAQALFAAITKAGGEADFVAIKKHLNEDTVETVIGPTRFDAKGDIIGAEFKMFQVIKGQFVAINP